ncbi:MAG: amidohydrolase family protein, partial [Ignavibacteria bacterium]|nr:amidohydrolase family protein [Ignavibacteria bacterium]
LEAIKSGTTAVIDHNASPNFILGSLNILKNSFEKVGLRGILSYEITDRNGIIGMNEVLKESERFINELNNQKSKNSIIEAAIGGHAPFTLSDKSLLEISDLVKSTKRGFHIHTAEDKYDSSYSHHLFDCDIMERLEKFKLVNDPSIFVHRLSLTNRDIGILNLNDAFLVHNPRSNMNNNVGYLSTICQIKNLAVGTDGIGSNMFDEVRFGYFKNKDFGLKQSPNDFLKYLNNGNKILEKYFGKKFGEIKVGYTADLVIYDYKSPTPIDSENLAGHFIFGFSANDVETVIVNGQIVYENKEFPFEVRKIYNESKRISVKLWRKIEKL